MSIDLTKPAATSLTIRPEAQKPFEYTTGKKVAATEEEFLGPDGFSFGTLLDIINPLQHIPIVSTIYRQLTGDTISPGAKVLGGGMLGGITGLLTSAADAIFTQEHGQDMGDSVFASLMGEQATKGNQALTDAEKRLDEKEVSLKETIGPEAAADALSGTRELLASLRANNDAIISEANSVAPITTASGSVPMMRGALNKYQQAQILSQMQSTMLNADKGLGETRSSREKDREQGNNWYDDPLLLNQDWLSQIT